MEDGIAPIGDVGSPQEPSFEQEAPLQHEEGHVADHLVVKQVDWDKNKKRQIRTLEKANEIARYTLTTLKIQQATVENEGHQWPDKLERLLPIQREIKTLNEAIKSRISSIDSLRKSQPDSPALRTAKKIWYYIIKGFNSPFALMGAVATQIQKGGYHIGAKRRGVDRASRCAVLELKKALANQNRSFIELHRSKTTHTFTEKSADAYTVDRNEAFNKELSHNNDLLTLALKNNRFEEVKYIIQNKLYKGLSLKIIRSISIKTPLDEQGDLITLLFTHATSPKDLSKIIHHLKFEGDAKLAVNLLTKGLNGAFKTADPSLLAELRLRCQLLALETGDNTLFSLAFPGFSTADFNPQAESSKGMISSFARKYGDVLGQTNSNGCTPLMHATIGGNPHMATFIAEAEKIHNEKFCQELDDLTGNSSPLTKILQHEGPLKDKGALIEELKTLKHKIQGIDYRHFKTSRYSNLLTHKIWVRSDVESNLNSLIAQLERQVDGINPDQPFSFEILLTAGKIRNRISTVRRMILNTTNPYLTRNKSLMTATHMMSQNFANALDNIYGFDGNAAGSFSSLLAYRAKVHKNFNKAEIASMMMGGAMTKWATAFPVVSFLNSHEHLGLIKSLVIMRAPFILTVALGVFAVNRLITLLRRGQAKRSGLTKCLSQYKGFELGVQSPQTTSPLSINRSETSRRNPIFAKLQNLTTSGYDVRLERDAYQANAPLLHAIRSRNPRAILEILNNDKNRDIVAGRTVVKAFRNLPSCYIDGHDKRGEILQLLADRCPPRGGERSVFTLFKQQINAGHTEAVGAALQNISSSIELESRAFVNNEKETYRLSSKMQGAMMGAALLGNTEIMHELLEGTKELRATHHMFSKGKEYDYLFAIREHNTGNSLLHLATLSDNPEMVLLLAKEINTSLGVKGTGRTAFEITNKSGDRIADIMTMRSAKRLDKLLGIDESTQGSFTLLQHAVETERRNKLYTEYGGVRPAKFLIDSLPVLFMHNVLHQLAAVALHATSGGITLLVEATAEFAVATAIGLMSTSLGNLTMGRGWHYATRVKRFAQGLSDIPSALSLKGHPEYEALLNARLAAAVDLSQSIQQSLNEVIQRQAPNSLDREILTDLSGKCQACVRGIISERKN